MNEALQVAPQSIPVGLLDTVPFPVPPLATLRAKVCRVKVAVTLLAWVMFTTQVPLPLQPAPLQPVKLDPVAGIAVRVTLVL